MTLFPSAEILRRRADIGLIVAFFALVWLPSADTFLHLDRAGAPNENRPLATFPVREPGLAGLGKFTAGLETYFADHFGFRNQLVRWEQQWSWKLFHDTRLISVLQGKGDWLFFSDGQTVNDITGARPFTDAELEAWRTLLTGRRDWLRQRGIRYLFVVPPDKQSIYPEQLPDWLIARAKKPQRLDQFLAHMRAHSDVPVLDLRDALLDAKKNGDLYLHTDSHWNERGAQAASRRIVQELASLGIAASAPEPNAYREVVSNNPGGDLALMLGQRDRLLENAVPLLLPQPPLAELEFHPDATLIPKKWIPGTEPLVAENPRATGKVVMFRDSFAITMGKFFSQSFGRTVYVWQQNWDKPFIERERPDIVIDEMLERIMVFRSPEQLRKADDAPNATVVGNP